LARAGRPTAVWTGTRMIVWGGSIYDMYAGSYTETNTGRIYDPATDSWKATSTTGAPPAASGHTAVWTGSRMIVWGGYSREGWRSTGGVYDPATDTWTLTSLSGAPSGRGYTPRFGRVPGFWRRAASGVSARAPATESESRTAARRGADDIRLMPAPGPSGLRERSG
jgi:hypothetical protein